MKDDEAKQDTFTLETPIEDSNISPLFVSDSEERVGVDSIIPAEALASLDKSKANPEEWEDAVSDAPVPVKPEALIKSEESLFTDVSDDVFDQEVDEFDPQPETRAEITSVREFFKTEALYRFDLLESAERSEISGSFLFEIRGEQQESWTLELSNSLNAVQEKKKSDVQFIIAEEDFLSLVNGKLNPQLALVSKRIKVNGDPKKASLVQNLLVPFTEN